VYQVTLKVLREQKVAMLVKQSCLKRKRFSISLTLFAYLSLPCYQTIGATISLGFNDELITELTLEAETFIKEQTENLELAIEEIVASNGQIDEANSILSNLYADQAEDQEVKNPLSIKYIVEAISQLNLEGNQQGDRPINIPILPQVKTADTSQGIYAFEATSNEPKKATNSDLSKNSNVNPTSPLTSSNRQISLTNVAAVAELVNPLNAPSLDPSLSMMPQNNINSFLATIDANFIVDNAIETMNRFGGLDIHVNFSLFPEIKISNSIQLKNNFATMSRLIKSDLKVTSDLSAEVQKEIQERVKEESEKQREREEHYQKQSSEQQERQQELARKRREQEQQRQKEQLERYLENQKKLQEAFHERMQRQ
jgi:hypothetical protein